MKVLVLGSGGQLGKCLTDQFGCANYEVIYAVRGEIDITNLIKTKQKIKKIRPTVVINASAYTLVDQAEEEPEIAETVNHIAVANLAKACLENDCWLIHFSTDYVFDGNSRQSYCESDFTSPTGVYGATKLRGERAIQSSNCKYLIIRSSWIFSEHGNNFLKIILRLASKYDEVKIVNDQVGCPTYAQDLAKAVVCMLSYLTDDYISGIYHYGGDVECSWFEFGVEIFQKAKEYGYPIPDNVVPISSEDYSTLSTRPSYSALNSDKALQAFGISPSDWREGISKTLKKLPTTVYR